MGPVERLGRFPCVDRTRPWSGCVPSMLFYVVVERFVLVYDVNCKKLQWSVSKNLECSVLDIPEV